MIKVMIPNMPTADDLLPYLRQIDEAKVYVNHGPLVQQLEATISAAFGASVAVVSNGTIALELAMQSIHESLPAVFVLPAITFAASGLAVKRVGIEPLLADVDPNSLQLTQKTVQQAMHRGVALGLSPKNKFGLMPVATFGSAVDVSQWEGASMPVVIDAAGAFDTQKISADPNIVTCFSLHATKVVGCGEGGLVVGADARRIAKIRKLANFGFNGTNAKMSEYHAAVALASIDRLNSRADLGWIAQAYRLKLNLRVRHSSTLCVVELPRTVRAEVVQRELAACGIETKLWYRPFLNEREDFQRQPLHVTDYIRDHLIGLPYHQFLSKEDVINVIEAMIGVLSK